MGIYEKNNYFLKNYSKPSPSHSLWFSYQSTVKLRFFLHFFFLNMNLITSKRLLLVHTDISIKINEQVLPVFISAQTEI